MRFSQFNEKCWRQNVLSGVHTLLSLCFLLGALLCDRGLVFGDARLYPHDSLLLYVDISMSLGYFSYSLPISIVMASAGFPFGSRVMVLHHAFVVVAQSTFLLTQYPSGFMAASGFLFELTNLFFIPHVLLMQLSAPEGPRTLLGVALVLVYTLARCVACTALALTSVADLGRFAPPLPSAWIFAMVGLICFYGLLAISWYWYVATILPALHRGLQQALGDEYYHACCPAPVRRAVWRRFTSEGRDRDATAQLRLQALQELRSEMATSTECTTEENGFRLEDYA